MLIKFITLFFMISISSQTFAGATSELETNHKQQNISIAEEDSAIFSAEKMLEILKELSKSINSLKNDIDDKLYNQAGEQTKEIITLSNTYDTQRENIDQIVYNELKSLFFFRNRTNRVNQVIYFAKKLNEIPPESSSKTDEELFNMKFIIEKRILQIETFINNIP